MRFLQEGEVRKIGSNRTVSVDTRIIAASHRDLATLVSQGTFREDLYARLARWVIRIPPLRERREDIPHLAQHFLRRTSHEQVEMHPKLSAALLRYPWPRNVRELEFWF